MSLISGRDVAHDPNAPMKLSADIEAWRDDWASRHGAPPRVLHIGNIANNAYNNAKLMIKAGFICDVICYDYYHIMGCPEWEDADFAGDVDDHFKPDWTAVDAPGYSRPKWFAQGPLGLCLDYLLARRSGDTRRAGRVWRLMEQLNGTRKPSYFNVQYQKLNLRFLIRRFLIAVVSPPKFQFRVFELINRVEGYFREKIGLEQAKHIPKHPVEFRNQPHVVRCAIPVKIRRLVPGPLLRAGSRGIKLVASVYRQFRRVTSSGETVVAKTYCAGIYFLRTAIPLVAWMFFRALGAVLKILVYIYTAFGQLTLRTVRKATRFMHRQERHEDPVSESKVFERAAALYRKAMPDRGDQLETDDIISNTYILHRWIKLFEFYDVIVGYSTDPIWPFLAGNKYFALEHGTLREIPFEKNRQGRVTALSYHYAEHAFVTNFDCIPNAKILCGDRFSFINHPYDEDHGLAISGVDELRKELCRSLDADFLVFFPTRQDWVQGTGFADKANDIFIRAFCRLRTQGHRIGMVCCDWGSNVRQTRNLLAEHACSEFVAWEEPMGIIRFERMSRACDLVADQFKLGAFGGVTFKALAVGVPVCTFLDAELLKGLYSELPPVINCRDEEEIVAELLALITEQNRLTAVGRASRAWIKTHHSGRQVVETQLRRFMASLDTDDGVIEKICAVN